MSSSVLFDNPITASSKHEERAKRLFAEESFTAYVRGEDGVDDGEVLDRASSTNSGIVSSTLCFLGIRQVRADDRVIFFESDHSPIVISNLKFQLPNKIARVNSHPSSQAPSSDGNFKVRKKERCK